MTHHLSRVLSTALFFVAGGCHSANWSPPEPQQAPPTVPPTAATAEPAPPLTSSSDVSPAPTTTDTAPSPTAPVASSSAPPAASGEAQAGPAGAKPTSSEKAAHKTPEAAPAPADAYTGPDPCQAKTFHYSAIGAACKKGGRKAVKDIMRGVVKKAKAAGQDVQCTSCHQDTSSFLLRPNAVSDIKQWF